MFLAALEMDTEGVRKKLLRFGVFGVLTCFVPLLLTYSMAFWVLHYSHEASMLLGCIMASNTLIAYPIVSRYGLQRKPSVALSVGSSMLSLLMALVMLAALVAANNGDTGISFWLLFIGKFVGYCAAMALIIPRLARWFLRRYSDAVMQFIFVLAMLFMSAALSEMIGVEGIFGAFLAGLILNRYIPHLSPLMNRIPVHSLFPHWRGHAHQCAPYVCWRLYPWGAGSDCGVWHTGQGRGRLSVVLAV